MCLVWHISVIHSFLLTNNIPLYGNTIYCLCIHQVIDICVLSTFWTFMYKFVCEGTFLLCLGSYLGMNLLGYMVIMFINFKELLNSFLKRLPHFTPTSNVSVLISPQPHQYLLLSFFFIIAILWSIDSISLWVVFFVLFFIFYLFIFDANPFTVKTLTRFDFFSKEEMHKYILLLVELCPPKIDVGSPNFLFLQGNLIWK